MRIWWWHWTLSERFRKRLVILRCAELPTSRHFDVVPPCSLCNLRCVASFKIRCIKKFSWKNSLKYNIWNIYWEEMKLVDVIESSRALSDSTYLIVSFVIISPWILLAAGSGELHLCTSYGTARWSQCVLLSKLLPPLSAHNNGQTRASCLIGLPKEDSRSYCSLPIQFHSFPSLPFDQCRRVPELGPGSLFLSLSAMQCKAMV